LAAFSTSRSIVDLALNGPMAPVVLTATIVFLVVLPPSGKRSPSYRRAGLM
jgi:hypothetical protein